MASPLRDYPLGRTQREYQRLALQADILQPMTRRLFEEAGIGRGMRVLDLGSGAGDVCLLLAAMVGPEGSVTGLEMDEQAIEHARGRAAAEGLTNVQFVHSDVAHFVPEAPVDVITGRLVLLYVPDPAQKLRALSEHLRPGGAVAFLEPWMMPATGMPESMTKRVTQCLVETSRRAGACVDIGPRLHHVFSEAGLPQPTMRLEAVMDGRAESPLYRYVAETLNSILPKAIEYGIAKAEDFDIESLPARLSAEGAASGYAMFTLPMVAAWSRSEVAR